MKSNKFAFTGLLCLLALLLNIASAMLASALKLPAFLDTIFTVAITFYAGLIPGIIVATLFNPVMTLLRCAMTGSEIFLYDFLYGICGILIVIASWLFSRNKKEFHFSRRTFVSSFSASALDTFIRPLFEKVSGFSAIDDISLVFQKMNFSVFLSYLLPRIPITLLDRCICTFAAYGIYSGLRK
ncbi:hypothetical protein [Treponema sp.]|uniref:hypothetical protein n=1 Tax=Treponema sp. TaxID=166 RepID=UPI00257F2A32|nr:hypothetical protein [Treponema sp.]